MHQAMSIQLIIMTESEMKAGWLTSLCDHPWPQTGPAMPVSGFRAYTLPEKLLGLSPSQTESNGSLYQPFLHIVQPSEK